jgi:hypothetical protein
VARNAANGSGSVSGTFHGGNGIIAKTVDPTIALTASGNVITFVAKPLSGPTSVFIK